MNATEVILICIIIVLLYKNTVINNPLKQKVITHTIEKSIEKPIERPIEKPVETDGGIRHERIYDPLTAPEMSHPFMMNRNKVPINIKTRGESMEYQQVGFIHSKDGADDNKMIFPLYGKELWRGSSKWSYYTGTDKMYQIKLPVVHNNKQCMSENGCDILSTGDTIMVPPYQQFFTVELYNLDAPRYIPI